MIYKVTAQLNEATAADLHRKLLNGTIAEQKPDGREIVASMQRAVVTPSGEVQWSEQCFCDSPLAHERETVLDLHFVDLTTESVDGYQEHVGRPFMEYLAEVAERAS